MLADHDSLSDQQLQVNRSSITLTCLLSLSSLHRLFQRIPSYCGLCYLLSLRRNNFVQFDIQVCSESVPVCILRALPETFNNDNVVFHIVTTFLKITVCYDSVSSIDRKRNRHRIIMLNHVKKRNEEVRLYKHDTEA